jgi:hypothetical protein
LDTSLCLCELALIVGRETGRTCFACSLCLIFPYPYASPLKNPKRIARMLPNVTGAPKNTIPQIASGSLFRYPTNEYVVDDVLRMHQADEYEMKMAPMPEYSMPIMRLLRDSTGKFRDRFAADQSSVTREQRIMMGRERTLL